MSRVLFLAISFIFIAGCSVKEVEKPIKSYMLSVVDVRKGDKSGVKVLKIERFKSPAYLDSRYIWYQKDHAEMNPYVYSQWSENFGNILLNNLTKTLYESKIFKSVFMKYSKIDADYTLEGEIDKAVQNIEDKSAYVNFGIRLYLVRNEDSKLIGSKYFSYKKRCDEVDSKGAVKAYDEIIKKLDKDVVTWLKILVQEN